MTSVEQIRQIDTPVSRGRRDIFLLCAIAFADALLHISTNGRYGFHRDELQFLTDAHHLAWGYVTYPPLTPFIQRIGLDLFGLSLVGLRLFCAMGQAIVILVTGLIARDLGGSRAAQVTAALAVALSPVPMFWGTEFQYTSFEFLFWVLIAWFVVRLLKTDDPRWWIAIGAAAGLGLMTKYSILFYLAGVLAGVVFTGARRYLKSGWFWAGIALAFLIVLPNLLWQVHNHFVSYEFLQYIHARDLRIGRGDHFLRDQIKLCINIMATPLALAGFIFFLRNARYRMIAWMYIVPMAILFFAKGRGYYAAAAYPMLLAAGSVVCAQWLKTLPKIASRMIATVFYVGLAAVGAYVMAVVLPFASSGPLRDFALSHNEDLREEIGWDDLVRKVASIRDTLTPEQQAHLGITVGNYGEGGAIEILGPAYHLPPPASTHNAAWFRGYPTPPPTTIIALGINAKQANSIFTGCRWAGHNGNSLGVRNEESQDHPDIFVCGPPRDSWPELWRKHRDFE
ncbi:MAG TPA: glycosyltransferase family 39 protein [Acidobacteriaceae bacterium]|nr:glycosyltransferase family 39 protein [Acidobacteriaceae bacterium]